VSLDITHNEQPRSWVTHQRVEAASKLASMSLKSKMVMAPLSAPMTKILSRIACASPRLSFGSQQRRTSAPSGGAFFSSRTQPVSPSQAITALSSWLMPTALALGAKGLSMIVIPNRISRMSAAGICFEQHLTRQVIVEVPSHCSTVHISGDDLLAVREERDRSHVTAVTIEHGELGARLCVPDPNRPVVRARDDTCNGHSLSRELR
jgi:hypothetical protein